MSITYQLFLVYKILILKQKWPGTPFLSWHHSEVSHTYTVTLMWATR